MLAAVLLAGPIVAVLGRFRATPCATRLEKAGLVAPSAAACPHRRAEASTSLPEVLDGPMELNVVLMATEVRLVAYRRRGSSVTDAAQALQSAVAEIQRLEARLSEWKTLSDVGQINAHAGEWVTVGPDALSAIRSGISAGQMSDGSFDITFQSLSGLWRFGSAQPSAGPPTADWIPDPKRVAELRSRVDFRRIEMDLNRSRVRLPLGFAIGLGGLAKGFILDRAAAVLRGAGLRDFLIQAGGDIIASGKKPSGTAWITGIQEPRGSKGSFFATLALSNQALSTAGDYARSFVFGGRRYHHIIDPKTGYPATACRSVSVVAPSALQADLLDDAIFVLGWEKGRDLVEATDGAGAVVVDAAGAVHASSRLTNHVRFLRESAPVR